MIYDSSKGFTRFLKVNFSDEYVVYDFFDFKHFKDIPFEEHEANFFIINELSELVDLMQVYSKKTSLFVGTRLPDISKNLLNIDNITIIDLTRSRQDIISFIRLYIKILAAAE